ncbi:MAG TPA: hypothetical protein VIL49_04980 [Capillimicrobium sp.]|jgi:hypothetical protein
MEVPWSPSIVALDALQASLVALPAAGLPLALGRFAGRWWALIPPVSIVAVVYGITALPGLADALTWLALFACPPLAAAALAWAMRGARPAYGLAALPLAAAAWAWSEQLGGHLAAALLTALSCVTLARLLRGVAPAIALKVGIVAMAVADAILILGQQLQGPADALNAATPAADLPRLQLAIVDPASLGYGDLFLAAVLGAVLAVEATRRQQTLFALVLLGLALAFDALFLVLDTLPATVPVALALGAWELVRRRELSLRGS